MKASVPVIRVEAAIQLNEKELKVLHEVFSYDPDYIADFVIEKLTKRIPKEDLKEVFMDLRAVTGKIMAAAIDAKTKCFKDY